MGSNQADTPPAEERKVANLIIPFAGSLGEVWGHMREKLLRAPFPYDGGKSKASEPIMAALGIPRNEVPRIVTLNDKNCFIANFWRAVSEEPRAVASYADWPVNEADMHARHRWLIDAQTADQRPTPAALEAVLDRYPEDGSLTSMKIREAVVLGFRAGYLNGQPSYFDAFQRKIRTDPHYYDVKFAGWWVWGQCMWIGSGWCRSVDTPGMDSKRPAISHDRGCNIPGRTVDGDVRQQLPDVSGEGGATGRGVHSAGSNALRGTERPRIAEQYSAGVGVHSNDSAGACAARREWLERWFTTLQDLIRRWRVCCGDWREDDVWKRVCNSESVTTRIGLTAVFLDPPYKVKVQRQPKENETGSLFGDGSIEVGNRAENLYAQDSATVADDVRAWCMEEIKFKNGGQGQRGHDPMIRIVLCGLEGEHNELERHGWTKVAWKSAGGYGNRGGNNENRDRERLWLSPHCVAPEVTDEEA